MADSDTMRASDADRERVIEALRQHTADGRLTMDEFEQRVGDVFAARTYAELRPVLRELPPLPSPPSTDDRAGSAGAAARSAMPEVRRRIGSLARPAAIAAVAVVAVTLIAQGAWWVVFPLWWFVLPVLGFGRGRHGRKPCGWGAWTGPTARTTHSSGHRQAPDVDDREVVRV